MTDKLTTLPTLPFSFELFDQFGHRCYGENAVFHVEQCKECSDCVVVKWDFVCDAGEHEKNETHYSKVNALTHINNNGWRLVI